MRLLAARRVVEQCIRSASRTEQTLVAPALSSVHRYGTAALRTTDDEDEYGSVRWVFLGAPGVGKGTYCSRLGKHLGVPHISMGDLVRDELKTGTPLASQMKAITSKGLLLPDPVVLELLDKRLQRGRQEGEPGFILDGFPRTSSQAAALDDVTPIDLAVNLTLRGDILMTKLLGRRMCSDCGGNFNIADIQIPASPEIPTAISMPPLPPPQSCTEKMTVRADDTEEIVRARLEVYYKESKPVEEFYRARGQLLEFEILGGIPETWPRLLQALSISEEPETDCSISQAG